MIADAGFAIEGADQPTLPDHHHDLVITRHRGAGTTTPSTPKTLINSDREVN
jgi:biotin synthase